MTESPILSADGSIIVQIKSNGKTIPDTVAVLSVKTETGFNHIPKAVLTLADGDAATNEFPVTDSDDFKHGAKIEILAGYGDDRLTPIFKGMVIANRLRMSGTTRARLEVTCQDEAYKLTLGKQSRVFEGKTNNDILASIAEEAGLKLTMDATSETFKELIQYQCSDWDFIVARAELNGMLVAVEDAKISVLPPDFSAKTALEVTYGIDVLSFDSEIDVRSQFESGETRSLHAELAQYVGTVQFQGNAKAVLGETLKLKGFGNRFSRTRLISQVYHDIEDGTWVTETRLGMETDRIIQRSDIETFGASGFTTPIRGLHIGKVTKLAEESKSQKLVQVRIPILGEKAAPIWCRFGTPYATNTSGMLFYPEIDDEVVVGFFNDDPGAGVVLGSLHSAKNVPPFEADESNNTKAIVTREQMKISFDEEKKSISIETPGGNMMVVDDDSKSIKIMDQHKNSIVMSSSGIVLDSPKDIKISAGGKVDISAKSDVNVEGANINANAQMALSAVGTASAELKASGSLTIEGAIVKIN